MPVIKYKSEKKVFISHASKDKEIVDAFVDVILHGAMSIELDDIFCTSTEGTKIESGEDWRDNIKASLESAKVTFLIITPNYKESEMCLNEMGAAWVLSSLVLPTIVEPITFRTVGVIPEVSQVKKLLDEIHIDDLRDSVQEALTIPASKIASGRWTQKKKEFIQTVKAHLKASPFPIAMDRILFDKLLEEKRDLNETIDNLIEEKQQLQSLVEALKEAKDKEEVKAIIRKTSDDSEVEEFKELIINVKKSLQSFAPAIQKIIFKDYARKDTITIRVDNDRSDLDDAVARRIIYDDLSLNDSNSKVKKVYEALNKLNHFWSDKYKKDAVDYFESTYDGFEFDMRNLDFWETVFEAEIIF